ncbi:MAG: DUF4268 domain-containing protein [Anaerolineaceae bacterium]|nr:DUF4268 domain-containing protein [Anaerolineaceae bacterium]
MFNLEKIHHLSIRDIWPDEARNFTPWLASKSGLEELSEELGVELELIEVECRSGAFKADIVAKISNLDEEEHLVIIENQLDSTDHDHLGKLITYASGHNAGTCVWIAGTFTDEHRQAIDWLNEHMSDIRFFALEVEVIRIGESNPAMRFKTISSPNQWSKAVRAIHDKDYSNMKLDQLNFWEELRKYSENQIGDTIRLGRTPRAQHWFNIAIGRSGFRLTLNVNSVLERVGCEIFMHDENAKTYFDKLLGQKEQIEGQLGYPLEWQRLDEKKGTRIAVYRSGSIEKEEERQELIEWLHQKANEFHRVFYNRIQQL